MAQAKTRADLEKELEAAKKELASIRERVPRIAREYARQNGWCSVVENALADMDLEDPLTVSVTMTLNVSLDLLPSEWLAAFDVDMDIDEIPSAFATRVEEFITLGFISSEWMDYEHNGEIDDWTSQKVIITGVRWND